MNAKKVKLNISSLIENLDSAGLAVGEPERDLINTSGEFSFSPEMTVISYIESREGAEVECRIVSENGVITVSRRGAVVCDLRFEAGVTHKTLYKVPPFTFDMSCSLIKQSSDFTENGGMLTILYKMNVGGADKKVKMKISLEAEE